MWYKINLFKWKLKLAWYIVRNWAPYNNFELLKNIIKITLQYREQDKDIVNNIDSHHMRKVLRLMNMYSNDYYIIAHYKKYPIPDSLDDMLVWIRDSHKNRRKGENDSFQLTIKKNEKLKSLIWKILKDNFEYWGL